jgi:hypothetical protein
MPQFEHERRQRDNGKVPPACASLAQLVQFGVEFCPRFFGDVLQLAEQVLVRFPVAVDKQSLGIAALSAGPYAISEPLSDFDRAGLVLLAKKGQGRARQIWIAVLPIGFVVSRHAAR